MSNTKHSGMEMDLYAQGPPIDLVAPAGTSTFEKDDSLPALPVPKLADTLALYMDSVRPIATSPQELETTRRLVEEFGRDEGRRLHQLLEEHAATTKNWLEDMWLEVAYMRSRVPLVPYSNIAGTVPCKNHVFPPSTEPTAQSYRSGYLIHYILRFWRLLRMEKAVPEYRRDGRSLSMHQLKTLFSTCRIPGEEVDSLQTYFCTRRQGNSPRHIIVSSRGRLFLVRPIDSQDRILTPPELTRAFSEILAYTEAHGWNPDSMCPLTTLPRSEWARNRSLLMEVGNNAAVLRQISESVLVVRLEDKCPRNADELALFALMTDGRNIWTDKSYSAVTFPDGTAMGFGDHAAYDGSAVLTLGVFVDQAIWRVRGKWSLDQEWDREALASWPYPDGHDGGLPLWEPLELSSNDHLRAEARRALLLCEENVRDVEVIDDYFYDFGRVHLRTFKVHPDTVIQLAIQLAFLRVHGGEPGSVYETASTRQYWHGRTETIRSCTQEAVDWARHVIQHGFTHPRSISLFVEAHRRHNALRSRCESALGCDRHLMALQVLSMRTTGTVPVLFNDPLWTRAGGGGNFRISSSFNGYYTAFGFMPPMCSNGYGVFYRIGLDRIQLFITAWHSHPETSAAKLVVAIHTSLNGINSLLEARGNQDLQIAKL